MLRFALLSFASHNCTNRCTGCKDYAAGDRKRAAQPRPNGPHRSPATPSRATVEHAMTAKEQLRERVEKLSEAEAADTLDYLASRAGRDALTELLENAPLDDEPTTPEEEEGLREAREQVARGEVISAEEIRREFA